MRVLATIDRLLVSPRLEELSAATSVPVEDIREQYDVMFQHYFTEPYVGRNPLALALDYVSRHYQSLGGVL